MENQTTKNMPKYGETLAQGIRKEISENPSHKPSEFERFVLDRGFLFETDEALKAGYDRYWKSGRNILITADEFITEAELGAHQFSEEERETAKKAYEVLAEFVKKDILTCPDLYKYAKYNWCLEDPSVIEVCQVNEFDHLVNIVNSCSERVSQEAAIIKINKNWGFEASRIKVIGTPYYESSDWQFIRFHCCGMSWLWAEENLYKVFE